MILMKKRILIAEDDPSLRKMMKLRLQHEGFVVFISGDGEEALREAEKDQPIDLVLLDVKMPRMDGYEVCRRLRAMAAMANVPIIIMTASEGQMMQLLDRCIEAGADDWIRKPFQTGEIMSKIHRLVDKGTEESHGA